MSSTKEWSVCVAAGPLTLEHEPRRPMRRPVPRSPAFRQLFGEDPLILAEAAVLEVLRRDSRVVLHPTLEHALLVSSDVGRNALARIHREYLHVARQAGLRMLISAPTWRANPDRVTAAGFSLDDTNQAAVQFVREIAAEFADVKPIVAGLMGCRGDAYRPSEALREAEAARFHAPQARILAESGVDVLLAVTMPQLEEARGMARALEASGAPFIISFVMGADGKLLDGSPLQTAIEQVEAVASPLGFGINCAHPAFFRFVDLAPDFRNRMVLFQGNGSSCSQADLDNADVLHVDSIEDWAMSMATLHSRVGIPIIGGCCGTDSRHLTTFLDQLKATRAT